MKKKQFITNQVQVKQFFHKGGCGDEKTKTKHRWRHCCQQNNYEIRQQQYIKNLSYFGRVTIHDNRFHYDRKKKLMMGVA
jgi:hypothetical protein